MPDLYGLEGHAEEGAAALPEQEGDGREGAGVQRRGGGL